MRLVERCRQGDQVAWEQLYRAHFAWVHRMATRLGARASEAEDVCQEVFLLAHGKLASFREGALRHWLYRFVANVVGNRRRRRQLRDALLFRWAGRGEEGVVTPEQEAGAREDLRCVRAALDALSAKKREVFVLYELEGMSGEEIAQLVGCNVATVWTRLFHARREFEARARAQGLNLDE